MQILLTQDHELMRTINATEYDAPCREIWKDVLPDAEGMKLL